MWREPLHEQPKPGQVWMTHKGHMVRIIPSRAADRIEGKYQRGKVNGHRGMSFDASGYATIGHDWLVKRQPHLEILED